MTTATDWTPARVSALRKHTGLTVAEFAHVLKVTASAVKYWEAETGQKRRPTARSRKALDRLAKRSNFDG